VRLSISVNRKIKTEKYKEKVAERTGLEPATPGVTGRYSNQLNYRSAVFFSATRNRLVSLRSVQIYSKFLKGVSVS
jgi:hypothetical protein